MKAEKLLYTAYIALMFTMYPDDEHNFETLIDMINASECREEDEEFKNAMDIAFDMLGCWLENIPYDGEQKDEYSDLFADKPDERQKRLGSFALKQYKAYKLAAGKIGKRLFTVILQA